MEHGQIKLSIASALEQVALIGTTIRALCHQQGCDAQSAYFMELCVVEAVNNCILHAYQNVPGHTVDVIIELAADRMTFHVCDTGRTIADFAEKCARAPNEFDPADPLTIPETGRGLFIMRELMDTLAYERIGAQNVLTMSRHV